MSWKSGIRLGARFRTAWHFVRDRHYPTAIDQGYLCDGCGLFIPYQERSSPLGQIPAHPSRRHDG